MLRQFFATEFPLIPTIIGKEDAFMQFKRILFVASLLLVAVLALTGCAPRPGAGEVATRAPADALVVDLPAIAIDLADDGSASVGGIPIADVGAALGVPIELPITAENVAMLKGLGIQHLQLVNLPSGLGIFVNGRQIPSLGWDAETLKSTADALAGQTSLASLLPVVTQLGIGVTLRLPVAEGATPAPLVADASDSAASRLAASQEAFLAEAGSRPTISIPINYNLDGTWTAGGFPSSVLENTPIGPFLSSLTLTPTQIQRDIKAGIESIDLKLNDQGLAIVWNGTQLPSLDWSGGKLASVIEVLQESGMMDSVGLDPAMLQQLLDTALPMLTSSDISIEMTFPTE
jgi:hypothetical protein